MHPGALAEIAFEKKAFRRIQRLLTDRIEFMLGENYELHTICAVERIDLRKKQKIYHVNFLATKKDGDDGGQVPRVLFFAQIVCGGSVCLREILENYSCQKNWKRSFCCPVTISAVLGRCFPCEFRAAKILHPIGIGQDSYGRQEKTYVDFANYISTSTRSFCNMDCEYLYFDSSVNTELATDLNQRAKEKEEMAKEEAYEAFLQ